MEILLAGGIVAAWIYNGYIIKNIIRLIKEKR